MVDKIQATKRIEAPTGNYYGGPAVWFVDGKYCMGTENWDGWDCIHISKEFYDAWIKEFCRD